MHSSRVSTERTPFIGRRKEIDTLLRELRGGARLLTLAGPSGIGKTRLARQILFDLGLPPASAPFVRLQGCRSAGEAQAAVAESLGISTRDGPSLASAIASRGRLLLVLDNAEEVAREASRVLEDWLDRAADLQILVTSIVPIGVEAEVRFEVGPLDPSDAVALYFERAHRACADRTFSDADRPSVEELVGRLDWSPLAIELAAARARILPPSLLLSRIDERFDLLQSDRKGRHGSLHRALSLTWELLAPTEQWILAQCSCFADGFTLEAAEETLSGVDESIDLLQALDDLRSKSLLQLDDSSPPRFSLYESVRDFAARELERSGRRDEIVLLHGRHFADRGHAWAERSEGSDALAAIRWLKAEKQNLASALRRCAPLAPEIAARAGLALSRLLILEGRPESARDDLEATLRAAQDTGHSGLIAPAMANLTRWLERHATVSEALERLHSAFPAVRASSDRSAEARLLVEEGLLLSKVGRIDDAFGRLERAISIARGIDDPLVEGIALQARGVTEERCSQLSRSVTSLRSALEIFRKGGNLYLEGRTLFHLLLSLGRQQRIREARIAYHEARRVFRRLEDFASEADLLANLGALELAAGRLDEAAAHLEEAMLAERRLGNRHLEALCVGNLGVVALEKGELALGEERLLEALASPGLEDGRARAEFLAFLSAAEALLGKTNEARRGLAEAHLHFSEAEDALGNALVDLLAMLPDLVDLSRSLRPAPEPTRARVAADEPPESDSLAIALRLVRRAEAEAAGAGARSRPATLVLAADGAWFRLGDSPRVDMRNRGPGRSILQALAEARLARPGVGLSQQELFEAGWEGESIHPSSAATRVYNAVRTLRSLGLAPVLRRDASGYLLDPELPIVRTR
ncbi:MAG TPA: hypothetical protein VGD74_10595 [Vulgatibacter sp.]